MKQKMKSKKCLIVSFRVGVDDASYLQREFAPIFNETDLINIEKYHVYVKTIVKNEPVTPFSMSLEKDMKEVEAKMNRKLAAAIKQLSGGKENNEILTFRQKEQNAKNAHAVAERVLICVELHFFVEETIRGLGRQLHLLPHGERGDGV